MDDRARRVLACPSAAPRRVLLSLPYPHSVRAYGLPPKPATVRKLAEFGLLDLLVGGSRLASFGRLVQQASRQLPHPSEARHAIVG
jgi:hypothetical protein